MTRERDLVFLINPAMEAAPYRTIDEFRFAKKFDEHQPPLILMMQSETDWPNQIFFPLGNALALRISKSERQSAGFWQPFRTHSLNAETAAIEQSRPTNAPWYNGLCIKTQCVEKKCLPAYCLDPDNGRPDEDAKNSPFLVVKTPKAMLDSHGWFSHGKRNLFFTDWFARFIDRHNCEAERLEQIQRDVDDPISCGAINRQFTR